MYRVRCYDRGASGHVTRNNFLFNCTLICSTYPDPSSNSAVRFRINLKSISWSSITMAGADLQVWHWKSGLLKWKCCSAGHNNQVSCVLNPRWNTQSWTSWKNTYRLPIKLLTCFGTKKHIVDWASRSNIIFYIPLFSLAPLTWTFSNTSLFTLSGGCQLTHLLLCYSLIVFPNFPSCLFI